MDLMEEMPLFEDDYRQITHFHHEGNHFAICLDNDQVLEKTSKIVFEMLNTDQQSTAIL